MFIGNMYFVYIINKDVALAHIEILNTPPIEYNMYWEEVASRLINKVCKSLYFC